MGRFEYIKILRRDSKSKVKIETASAKIFVPYIPGICNKYSGKKSIPVQ